MSWLLELPSAVMGLDMQDRLLLVIRKQGFKLPVPLRCWEIQKNINGSGHKTVTVLLPGFAINWQQNQVRRQPQFRDLTQIYFHVSQNLFKTTKVKTHPKLQETLIMLYFSIPVASFTKEVNTRLAKRPLVFNGRLANRGLTSLVKEVTGSFTSKSAIW